MDKTLIEQLDNGLTLCLIERESAHHTCVQVIVNYGAHHHVGSSKDSQQAGIAHFLEHLILQSSEKDDLLGDCAKMGVELNACTSADQTIFTLIGGDRILTASAALLNRLMSVNFSVDQVIKERSIIEQELALYQDNPYEYLSLLLLAKLYPDHVFCSDIVGSQHSLDSINVDQLTNAYDSQYQLMNMALVKIGHFSNQAFYQQLATLAPRQSVFQNGKCVKSAPLAKEGMFHVNHPLVKPMALLGWRFEQPLSWQEKRWHWQLIQDIFWEMLLGETSQNYETWLKTGLIHEDFTYQADLLEGKHDLILLSTSEKTDECLAAWQRVIMNWQQSLDMNSQRFEAVKAAKRAQFIWDQQQITTYCENIVSSYCGSFTYFDYDEDLSQLAFEDVWTYGQATLASFQLAGLIVES
ncbi:M16 family metallopeptidase [Vaginisenegalia massiliensis]|uniref:M16 family metallopeptidase n=1 Tax=Vaginisenegalia massiliensis TaxID=2058294 RepID=UPI000F5290AC|nr:insulinase family protein [Vaginisenegalia massiliensis]